MRQLLIMLVALGCLVRSTQAQTADEYVILGRAYLAAHNLTNADSRFASALQLAPNHSTGNVFRAFTRLLGLADKPAGAAFLDSLDFSRTNRSVYHWSADVPRDLDGAPIWPSNKSAADITAFLRTTVLAETMAAGSNLAAVTDTNFILQATSAETTLNDVTIDYGDLLMVRSILKFSEYFEYTLASWNLEIRLTNVTSLLRSETVTAQNFLSDHPDLFTFATTNDLSAARQAFSDAITLYLSASEIIRARPANVSRLFNWDDNSAGQEADFRSTLVDLRQSLNGPVEMTLYPAYALNTGNAFSGKTAPRQLAPQFLGNAVIAGTLPDASLGGLVQGLEPYDIQNFLGHSRRVAMATLPATPFLTHLRVPQRLPDNRFRIAVDALDGAFYTVQSSSNMVKWTSVAGATASNGSITFDDDGLSSETARFYRALERSDRFTADGTVLDIVAGKPINNAEVGLSISWYDAGSHLLQVNRTTDSQGHYDFVSDAGLLQPGVSSSFQIQVTAPGYPSIAVYEYGQHVSRTIYLAPQGYRPPNDDFARSQSISGTNLTVFGATIGASSEPGEGFFGGYPTIWYHWTAPVSGAVRINSGRSSFYPNLDLLTGNGLDHLDSIAKAGPDLSAFVDQGVTYRIRVAGGSGRVVLNLRMVTPKAPTLATQPSPETVRVGGFFQFYASVTGTPPIGIQWQRNGVDVPGGTTASFYRFSAQLIDAGEYTVVASNRAGSVTSRKAILTVVP